MTQYMLKMLTILTNILVTNLIAINSDSSVVGGFIDQVVVCLTQSACPKIRARLNELDSVIPKAKAQDSVEAIATSYGCSLLKELAFKFLTYTQDEVGDVSLRRLLLSEFATIISNQIVSSRLYHTIITKPEENINNFGTFFEAKTKKMNYEMMLLADCVPLLSSGEEASKSWTEELKKELISYVKSLAEVAEVRAVAYHDIASVSTP